MRSPSEMDIVQIDVTNKCHLRCSNCTRLVAHQAEPFEMELDVFQRAVESMQGWDAPGRILGLIGGEPTLHGQFEEIARLFYRIFGADPWENQQGRKPIKDFNAYVQERLRDRRSGRGLWTSLGAGYYKHYEIIQEVFDHQTVNTHEHPGVHQALLITRKELGIPDEEWIPLRDKCWVQNLWSASITPHGAYFCEVAGALDNLLYQGKHAWPVEEGWWKRTPDQFGDQLQLCEHCSLALSVPAVEARLNRDLISPDSLRLLGRAGSPAVARGKFNLWDPVLEQETREVTTIDSYLPAGRQQEVRVAAGHKSVLPKKVTGIVVCVGCADQLQATLPFNLSQLEEMVVVTTNEDVDTAAVVATQPRARLVRSDRCYDDDHAFNKGKLINDALRSLDRPDWILLTDADVLFNPYLKEFLGTHALNPGCLYGTLRRERPPWEQDVLTASWPLKAEEINTEPNGYFQLYHPQARVLRDRGTSLMSEAFCSAGGMDSWFMHQYPPNKRVVLPELTVDHFGHGALGGRWNGPRRRTGWHQVGLLTPEGMAWLETGPREIHGHLRLTDTLHGRHALCTHDSNGNLPPEVVTLTPQKGFRFLGDDIGHHHIHVAAWLEEEHACVS